MSNSPQFYAQQIFDNLTDQEKLVVKFARPATLLQFVVEKCPDCVQDNCTQAVMDDLRERVANPSKYSVTKD